MTSRPWRLSVRVSDAELDRLNSKMEEVGISNRSLYIRKMILDGYCVNLDTEPLKEMIHLLRICSNNLNQYARHANGYGEVYAKDIADVQKKLDDVWDKAREILAGIAVIR